MVQKIYIGNITDVSTTAVTISYSGTSQVSTFPVVLAEAQAVQIGGNVSVTVVASVDVHPSIIINHLEDLPLRFKLFILRSEII